MGRIIAIANQKGGVGKTTTAINLAACLAEKKNDVLVIDIDPQGNTTSGLGVKKKKLQQTVYDMMLGNCTLEQCKTKSAMKNLFVLPANVELAEAELELINVENREFILKSLIEGICKRNYFIMIVK